MFNRTARTAPTTNASPKCGLMAEATTPKTRRHIGIDHDQRRREPRRYQRPARGVTHTPAGTHSSRAARARAHSAASGQCSARRTRHLSRLNATSAGCRAVIAHRCLRTFSMLSRSARARIRPVRAERPVNHITRCSTLPWSDRRDGHRDVCFPTAPSSAAATQRTSTTATTRLRVSRAAHPTVTFA